MNMSVSLGISGTWVVPMGMRIGVRAAHLQEECGSVKGQIERENKVNMAVLLVCVCMCDEAEN